MQGQTIGRSLVPRPRRRLPPAAEVVDRMVPGLGQESQGAEHHPARPTPHVRVARGVCRGGMYLRCNGCSGTSPRRSRWTPTPTCSMTISTPSRSACMPGTPRHITVTRPSYSQVGAKIRLRGGHKGQLAKAKMTVYLRRCPHRISAGGGTRTLFGYPVNPPKSALPAKTRHSDSRSNTQFGGRVWAGCGHGVGGCP